MTSCAPTPFLQDRWISNSFIPFPVCCLQSTREADPADTAVSDSAKIARATMRDGWDGLFVRLKYEFEVTRGSYWFWDGSSSELRVKCNDRIINISVRLVWSSLSYQLMAMFISVPHRQRMCFDRIVPPSSQNQRFRPFYFVQCASSAQSGPEQGKQDFQEAYGFGVSCSSEEKGKRQSYEPMSI